MLSKDPLITIVIPTFNSGKVLIACLGSIFNQTYNNIEVIIQDACSTDNTRDLVIGLAKPESKVSLLVFQENDSGIYDAMNKAIARARGEWLLFLGSDDRLYDETVLRKCVNHLNRSEAELVYGNAIIAGTSAWAKDGDIYDGEFDLDKLFRKNICHQAIFYRRSIFETIGKFNLNYPVCADWDFNHRCFGSAKVEFIPETISIFHSGGLSTVGNADGFYKDAIFNLKSYHRLSYLNRLFHHYTDAFHLNAGLYFKQRKILQAIRFYLYFLYHKFL